MDDQRPNSERINRLNQRLALGVPLIILGTLGLLGTGQLWAVRPQSAAIALIVSATLVGSGIVSLFESKIPGVLFVFMATALIMAIGLTGFAFVAGK